MEDIWIPRHLDVSRDLDQGRYLNLLSQLSTGFENELVYQTSAEYNRLIQDTYVLRKKEYKIGYQTVKEVVDIRQEALEESVFLPPADYKPVTLTELGIITMIAVGSSAVASLAAVHMAERYGNTFTIVLGAVLVGASTLAIPFIHHVFILEAVMVSYGLGSGVLGTILMALSIRSVAPQQRATAMGVYQAVYAVGMLFGPLLSGIVGDNLGLASVFYLSASLCLVIAGLAFLPVIPRR